MLMCKYNQLSSTNRKESSDPDQEVGVEEKDEDSISTKADSGKSVNRYRTKINNRKRLSDICSTLNLYDKCGNIYVKDDKSTLYIAKIRKVYFPDASELFEKGKRNLGNYFNEDIKSIPDITFWYQRYYYYKRFDEGIKMDYECIYSF